MSFRLSRALLPLLLGSLAPLDARAGSQSIRVSSGTLVATLPNAAPWTTIGSDSQPMRWEFRIHGWNSALLSNMTVGPFWLFNQNDTHLYLSEATRLDELSDAPFVTCCAGRTDILIRIQRDVANHRYTFEVCDAKDGANCVATAQPIKSCVRTSWAGAQIALGAGYDVAFLRWYSSVVPYGLDPAARTLVTPIRVGGTLPGELGDWEFEGNARDSSGHGLNMQGAPVSYLMSPAFRPSCVPGPRRSFRAGDPATLDASGSSPLDGGDSLTYQWQQVSGPLTLVWNTAQNIAKPQVRGILPGSYVFQLTVTDGSGQSSTCTVKDGAVATDESNIVITGDTAVDTLLGPMIQWGRNSWPWYDDRHMKHADLHIRDMDAIYPAWWDNLGPGTIEVRDGDHNLYGTGTSFTTTLCQGPDNPTKPKPYATVAVWYNRADGTTGRTMYTITSCASDTLAVMEFPWDAVCRPAGSRLQYGYGAVPEVTNWGWAQVGSPYNYYDNVAAYYALYYRSGIDDYLAAARKLADEFWKSPMLDEGTSFVLDHGSQYTFTGRSLSMMGMVLRALDGRPEMWTGIRKRCDIDNYYLNRLDLAWGMWDEREMAYHLLDLSYCALFDPNPATQATYKAAISSGIAKTWTANRGAHDWSYLWYAKASWDANGGGGNANGGRVTLGRGSRTVTGSGTNWAAGDFPATIWFLNSTARPARNSDGDPVVYTATYVSPTVLTLDRLYEGASGVHGWATSTMIVGYGFQPFVRGILASAFDLASKAIDNSDPVNSALAQNYALVAVNDIKTLGYWPATKGLLYFAGGINCQPPASYTNSACTQNYSPEQARALNAEAIRGIMFTYAAAADPALKDFADTLYSAMWSKPGTGSPEEDGVYLSDEDDSGFFFTSRPPGGSKWLGMFFGFASGSAWPALRVGAASGANPSGGQRRGIRNHDVRKRP
jgi:hypothetical protein